MGGFLAILFVTGKLPFSTDFSEFLELEVEILKEEEVLTQICEIIFFALVSETVLQHYLHLVQIPHY